MRLGHDTYRGSRSCLRVQRQKGLNATAIRVVGMGSWRLKSVVSPLLEAFVANIEGAWRHLIDDLGLHQLPPVSSQARVLHLFWILYWAIS